MNQAGNISLRQRIGLSLKQMGIPFKEVQSPGYFSTIATRYVLSPPKRKVEVKSKGLRKLLSNTTHKEIPSVLLSDILKSIQEERKIMPESVIGEVAAEYLEYTGRYNEEYELVELFLDQFFEKVSGTRMHYTERFSSAFFLFIEENNGKTPKTVTELKKSGCYGKAREAPYTFSNQKIRDIGMKLSREIEQYKHENLGV